MPYIDLIALVDTRKVSESFVNERYEVPWSVVIIGLGGLLAAIAAVSLYRWWHRRNEDPSATVIFSAIARKAGLTWKQRLLLWRIARKQKLTSPIALLLARGTLMHHASSYAHQLSPRAQNRLKNHITELSQHLFGSASR